MPEPCLDGTCGRCLADWDELYGAAVRSDNANECDRCGARLEGDKPTILIVCFICFQNQSA